jgi:hypothetical protein
MHRRAALLALGALFVARAAAAAPAQRGIALGLFAEDPAFSYEPLLREIARAGASHVSIVVPWYQHDVRSTELGLHPRFSPTAARLERTLVQARALGLAVLLFPIVRLEYALTADEWRGNLEPADPAAWWRSYARLMLAAARLAAKHGAAVLAIGSELGSLDGKDQLPRWRELVARVRALFGGRLIYSANWDRYDRVALWPLVDLAGLSAYFPLTEGLRRPPLARLIHGWREQRVVISRWRARVAKPLVVTELGYHSRERTNAFPWDEASERPIDLQEQADCYRAFRRAFDGAAWLEGVYFWNWFGWGGRRSHEYCPRGKPAALEICAWYGAPPARCPREHGMPWFDAAR